MSITATGGNVYKEIIHAENSVQIISVPVDQNAVMPSIVGPKQEERKTVLIKKNTGKLIDEHFKRTYLIPMIRDIYKDIHTKNMHATNISIKKLLRKITVKGLIYFPNVFTDDLLSELKSQVNRNYINRIYMFFCGKYIHDHCYSVAGYKMYRWNIKCMKRANQYEIDEISGNLKKQTKFKIEEMSSLKFTSYCQGIYNKNEKGILTKKRRQEIHM